MLIPDDQNTFHVITILPLVSKDMHLNIYIILAVPLPSPYTNLQLTTRLNMIFSLSPYSGGVGGGEDDVCYFYIIPLIMYQ